MQKIKNNKNQEKLIKLLIKKAEGFFYTEESFEYSYNEKPKKNIKQISFFDGETEGQKENKKSCLNSVTKTGNSKNSVIDLNCEGGKKVKENAKGKQCDEDKQAATLVKKKDATHFVPPDMLAIKMLLEINESKIGGDLSVLSDEELASKINELKNELGI